MKFLISTNYGIFSTEVKFALKILTSINKVFVKLQFIMHQLLNCKGKKACDIMWI